MKHNDSVAHGTLRWLLLLCVFCLSGPIAALAQPGTIPANFKVDKSSGCAPLTVNFTDLSPNTVTTWSWDVDNDGINDYNVANPTHTYSAPGTYTVTLNVSDAPGISTGTITATITVLPPPTADAGSGGMVSSGGLPINLGGAPTASAGLPPYTYSWSPAAGLSSPSVANPTAFPSATTLYTVTVTDANGCTATDTATVFMSTLKADAGADFSLCPGSPQFIGGAAPASGGTGPYTYIWSPATGLQYFNQPNPAVIQYATTQYVLTVTDAVGSIARDTMIVNITGFAKADAGMDKRICQGDSVQIGGSPAGSGVGPIIFLWTPSTGLNSATASNPIAKPSVTTTYVVQVWSPQDCAAKDTVTVYVDPAPNPSLIASGPTSICQGDSVTLKAPTGLKSYMWSTGATTSSITVKSTGQYWVDLVSMTGCPGKSDTVSVTVNPIPSPKLGTSGPTSFCQGDSVTLSATPGFASYLWSNGATTPSIIVKKSGTYWATATSAAGCSGNSDTVAVQVNSLPSPKLATGGPTTFCQGDSVKLTAPAGFAKYLWNTGESTPSIVVRDVGNYFVTVTNSSGCPGNSDTVSVTVLAPPSPKLTTSGPTSFCLGGSVMLNAPGGFTKYLWSTGATTKSITVKDSGNYWVNVTNVSGCTGRSDTVSVTVLPLPAPKLSQGGSAQLCQGDSLQVSAPAGFTSYAWSNGDTTQSTMVKKSGIYSVLVTNSNGCQGRSDSLIVSMLPLPTPKLIAVGSTNVCAGDSVQIVAPGGFAAYLWSTGATTQSIMVGDSGNYSVMVTNGNGCKGNSDTIAVKVLPLPSPVLTANGPTSFCQGGNVTLKAPAGFAKYLWSTGATTPTITVKDSGNYWVSVTNASGCKGNSDTVYVTVLPLPAPTLSANGSTKLCQGDSVQIDAPAGFAAYRWTTGDTTQSITVKKAGNYSVLVTNANGCQGRSDTVAVSVLPLPSPKLTTTGSTSICPGGNVTINAPAGFGSYLWSTGDTTQSIVATDSGRYYVAVTNSNGCLGTSDTVTVKVLAPPSPKLSAGGPTTFCEGGSVTLNAPTGFISYLWSTGETTRSIVAKATGNYYAVVTNASGCQGSSDTIAVSAMPLPAPVLSASGPTTFCQGDSVMLQAPAGFDKYRWSNGDTNTSITVGKSGSYFVSVTNAGGCTGNSDTVAVTVRPTPKPVITASGSTSICSGTSVDLSAPKGYASYIWSTGETTQTITVSTGGSYAVSVSDTNGCFGTSDSIAVKALDPVPVPVISLTGATKFCQGDSATLTVPAGYAAYRWSTGDTGSSLIVRNSGMYSVMVTGSNGCVVTSDSLQITVHPTPNPDLMVSGSPTLCQGDSITVTAPAGYVSYKWSTGDSAASIIVSKAGTYTVDVADSNGCFGTSKPVTVTVNTPPVPTIAVTGSTSFCEGGSAVLEAPHGFASYTWSNGSTDRAITVTKSGIYTVMVTDSIGCHGTSDSITVRVNPLPAPTITSIGRTTFCDGDSVRLQASAGFAAYHWSTGDTSREIVVKTSGSYSVDVIDSIGCVGTSATAVNVDVHALPQAEISGEPQICQDAEATYSVEGDSTHLYIWKVKGAMGAITKGQGTQSISVRWADSGMATVSVIVRDTASGCVASDTLAVLVGRPFTPVITGGGSSMCAGDSMTLDAGAGYARYLWSTGDTTRTISVMGKGKYEVTVWNAGGCVGSAKLTIDRIFAAPKPSLSVIGTARYPGDTLLLAVLPDGYLRYSWHKNGEWLTKDTTRFLTARENGVYNVEVTDSNGCHGSAEVYLDMWKVPTTIISIPKIEAAPGQFVALPLQLSGHNLNPNESRPFTATIRYNGTMLMPADTTPLGVMDPVTFERVLTIQGVNRGGMDDSTVTLSMMHFQVMLGDTDFTDLKIESFAWADTNIKVTEKLDGMVHLDKVCREGVQARYIRPGGQFALKPVQPNPVDGSAKISFSVLEIGALHLDVADLKGNVVATLADGEYKQGDYDVTFNTSDLPTGTYLLRLQTPTGIRTNELIVKH